MILLVFLCFQSRLIDSLQYPVKSLSKKVTFNILFVQHLKPSLKYLFRLGLLVLGEKKP